MKERVKKTVSFLKKWITKDFAIKKTIISCVVLFSSFLLVFPAGAVSNQTVFEYCSDYYAEIAKSHINDNGEKKLSGLVVEPIDGKDVKMRRDTDKAITELWGVFKGNNASFAPVMNANHINDVRFKESDYGDQSLSLVYTYDGQSTIPYHTVKDDKTGSEIVIDHKFQCSPIALMFPSTLSGITKELHIYISQARAERKLFLEGKEINKENLQSLQGEPTQILLNGKICNCIIDNIYLDNFDHAVDQPRNPKTNKKYDYYYATDIETVIGDFVFAILTHIDAKTITIPPEIKNESLYIMSEHSFRNRFYLEYAKESYSPENYSFDFARYNLKSDFVPNDKVLQNAISNSSSDASTILLTTFSVILFVFALVLIYLFKVFRQPLSLIILSVFSTLPFIIFKIVFLLSSNTYLFSSYSLIINLIMLVVLVTYTIVINCFCRKIKEENHD